MAIHRALPRRSLFLSFLVVLLASAPPASARTHYRAAMDGLQEVPPSGSPGVGQATCLIDTNTNTLFYFIEFSGLAGAETAAHIHGFAAPGENAGVVHALPPGSPKVGAWSYSEAQEPEILAGRTYVNVHSTVNPGGELRGQIVLEPATDMTAVLQGLQEVPPTGSAGLGIATFEIDIDANVLSYDVRFAGLSGTETAAHIHGFAPPGANAGVLAPLPAGSPKIGTWNYAQAQEANLFAGLTYVNVHSTLNPGGEIRGQIEAVDGVTGVEALSASDSGLHLAAAPNPVRNGNVAIFFSAPAGRTVRVTVLDVAGRVVRRVHDGLGHGSGIVAWDTRDDAGRAVASGVYYARLEVEGTGTESRPVVVTR